MNHKSFNLGDWIGHISGVIEDETTLDGNEMRDLVEFLTTLNQQPCEDCISRQVVLDMLEDINAETEGVGFYYEHYVEYIKNLPSVTPKEKTGKWIRWYETIEQEHCTIHDPHCKCSECNQEYDPYIASLFNYCPNCGAKM